MPCVSKSVHVDVIIPVHNASATIEETLKSIFRQNVPEWCTTTGLKENDATTLGNSNFIQVLDSYKRSSLDEIDTIHLTICCYDDGSTDDSWNILKRIKQAHEERSNLNHNNATTNTHKFNINMLIASNAEGIAQGAAYARNRAVELNKDLQVDDTSHRYLCFIDSDDIMHEHRVAHQLAVMLAMTTEEQNATLLGCTFDRIPKDSTWHYTKWANCLSDTRLLLEQYREITVIQPTWFMTRSRFEMLGGYVESSQDALSDPICNNVYRLVHSEYDSIQTLRLAEDLRFFHAHLSFPYRKESCIQVPISTTLDSKKLSQASLSGTIKLVRTSPPLMTYRHREGQSQSSSTSRKLLLHLRAKAFVDIIVKNNSRWQYDPSRTNVSNGFVIWGAGRDGKDFFKSLSHDDKYHVRCFVDVDDKKIQSGYYMVPFQTNDDRPYSCSSTAKQYKIPIVHYSMLIRDETLRHQVQHEYLHGDKNNAMDAEIGKITKRNPHAKPMSSNISKEPPCKKSKKGAFVNRKLHAIPKKDEENHSLMKLLPTLPVVVCVAMYRSNGILERNVESIGRKEGVDLWHFS